MKSNNGHHRSQPAIEDHAPQADDPFDGFFSQNPAWLPEKGGLLDNTIARRWFRTIGWGMDSDLYTYQQRFDGKAGPEVCLDNQHLRMMSSYDYLGLIGHADIEAAAQAAVSQFGTGTGGVRLLTGSNKLHRDLETEIARFKEVEAAMTFTSGYMANMTVIAALMGPRDCVIIDSLAHRSIVDACRLARVPVMTFEHNDLVSLEKVLLETSARRRLIIAEGIYSMDGDICPLPGIVELKKRHNAYLMIDEAHSIGVLGSEGRGVHQHWGVAAEDVDIWMGSLSKAIPANGGYLAGSKSLIIYLQHGGAPFMFSAALCPAATAAAKASIEVIQRESWRISRVNENAIYLKTGLRELGYDTGQSESCIVPVICGRDEDAWRLSRALFDKGIITSAVVFPAVQRGKARLRLCVTAAQSKEMLDTVLSAFREQAHVNNGVAL